jgi:3-hydroxyisobutyrate dehydrogenase-like beta-hydroxyacid dehydrogenase
MGFGMASQLLKVGSHDDVYEPTRARFQEAGGDISQLPRAASRGARILILMIANRQQVDSVDSGLGLLKVSSQFFPHFLNKKHGNISPGCFFLLRMD